MISDTIAIVVLYNLEFENFIKNEKYFTNFHRTIVVNNNSHLNNFKFSNNHFVFLNNYNNYFLAGAYNLGLDYIRKNNFDVKYIAFFDEDSEFKKINEIFNFSYFQYFNNNNKIASISPQYFDINSQSFPNYLQINKYYLKYLNNNQNFLNVTFTINSFSVWTYKSILEIGYFDTKLMLDHIDTDYCLRANLLGYSIFINRDYTFNHSIGQRIPYRFCFFNFNASNHTIVRRIFITKNSILILKKHFKNFPILFYLIITRLIYDILGILIVEKNKILKLKSIVIGIYKSFKY